MRSARITLVELFVLVVVFGILAALLLPSSGSRPPLTDKDLALELDNWQPGAADSAVPSDSLRVRDADLAGAWTDRIGWTKMSIQPEADGCYSVSFLSRARCGMSGRVQLERIAKYGDGVLLFDRPVRELSGATYERLYSIRVEDTICLIPSFRVSDVPADATDIPYRGVLARATEQ